MNVYLKFFNFDIQMSFHLQSSMLSLYTEEDMGQILGYQHMYIFWAITWLKEAAK